MPTVGTITIDANAAGVGWFIDATPFDHAEFGATADPFAFQVLADSQADGKYDLYTVLLHEVGHLLGFMAGVPGFDARVGPVAGSRLFVGDGFTAALDDDHLDSSVYPYDLMNATLAPSVRKLPSPLDVRIINAVRESAGAVTTGPLLRAALHGEPIEPPNSPFVRGVLGEALSGWAASDPQLVTFSDASPAILRESATAGEVSLYQDFVLPAGAKRLAFTLTGLDHDDFLASGFAPDAFGVSLMGLPSLDPHAPAVDAFTDSYFITDLDRGITSGQVGGRAVVTAGERPDSRRVVLDTDGLGGQSVRLFFRLLSGSDQSQVDAAVAVSDVTVVTQDVTNPVIDSFLGDAVIDENDVASFTGSFIDAGLEDAHQLVVEWGDGSRDMADLAPGVRDFALTHRYADDADHAVHVTLVGEDLGVATATREVHVRNVAPTIAGLSVTEVIDEGGVVSMTATFHDAGAHDSLTLEVGWGDGETVQVALPPGSTTYTLQHQYLDNAPGGAYAISVRLTDKDGGSATASASVNVRNLVPTLSVQGADQADVGATYTLELAASDAGTDSVAFWTVHWGDGTSENVSPGRQRLTHTFRTPGTAIIQATATDEDGTFAATPLQVSLGGGSVPVTVLTAITEDDVENAGQTVASVLGSSALGGIAITSAGHTGGGEWQFRLDGSADWVPFGAVSPTDSLVLGPADRVRFRPDGINGETGAFGFLLSEQTEDGARAATITVAALNDAPSLVSPASLSGAEDADLAITGLSVVDVDAGTGPLEVTLKADHGVITLGTTAGLSFSVGDGMQDTTMTFQGALDAIDAALASLTYRGLQDYSGPDLLSLAVSDLGNGGDGGALTDTDVIALALTPVNDRPVLTAPATAQTFRNKALPLGGLISVSDADGADDVQKITLKVERGTLALGSTVGLTFEAGFGINRAEIRMTGTLTAINATLAGLRYVPTRGLAGADSLRITIDDLGNTGGPKEVATQVIALNVVARPPVVTAPPPYVVRGKWPLMVPAALGLLAGASSPDGAPLTVRLLGAPRGLKLRPNGSFVYTPPGRTPRTVRFRVRVFDGLLFSDPITVVIHLAGGLRGRRR